jgi:hypothetical protein
MPPLEMPTTARFSGSGLIFACFATFGQHLVDQELRVEAVGRVVLVAARGARLAPGHGGPDGPPD